MQEVRYPNRDAEWARLKEVLMSAQDGFGAGSVRLLDDDIDVDHVMAAMKNAAQKARYDAPSTTSQSSTNSTDRPTDRPTDRIPVSLTTHFLVGRLV